MKGCAGERMKKNPEISIVIPSLFDKKRAKYLPETIQSVRDQTFKDYEIIIVNLQKNPELKKELNKITKKIKYYKINEPNSPKARNLGAREAKGKYLAFLDDDDLWEKYYLETKMKKFAENPETDIVISDWQEINEKGRILTQSAFKNKKIYKNNILKTQMLNNIFNPDSIMLKKELMKRVKFRMENAVITDFGLRCLAEGYKTEIINRPLSKYRIRADSYYRDPKNEEETRVNEIRIWQDFTKKYPHLYPTITKKRLSQTYKLAAAYYFYLEKNNKQKAKEYAIKSLKTKINLGATIILLKIVTRQDK